MKVGKPNAVQQAEVPKTVCEDETSSDEEETTEVRLPKTTLPETVRNDIDEGIGVVNNVKLKKGLNVRVTGLSDQSSGDARLVSRAGKSTGKYKDCWNVQDCFTGDKFYIDFDKVNWSECESTPYLEGDVMGERELSCVDAFSETSEECLISSNVSELRGKALWKAKMDELLNWKSNKLYKEVEDKGQEKISVRKESGEKVALKARLCARGFKEIQDFRKDSHTCSKESVRLALSLASSLGWPLNCLDVKTAFLQGDHFDREVFLKPPREARLISFGDSTNVCMVWQMLLGSGT